MPDTIGKLVRWFANPRVGAVAGNARVGNRVNLITRWQAIEYVTAQNVERRALDALKAITVVPGAVGAWRRAALDAVGGYPEDTLAEDQDLTIAIQRAGWWVEYDVEAIALTEAPETFRALAKQRYRWSFGTLQCLWKHRVALKRGRPRGPRLVRHAAGLAVPDRLRGALADHRPGTGRLDDRGHGCACSSMAGRRRKAMCCAWAPTG